MKHQGRYHDHLRIQTTAEESLADAFPSYHVARIATDGEDKPSYRVEDHSVVISHIDSPGIKYRTLIAQVGSYVKPSPSQHLVLHFHPKIVKAPADTDMITPGVGIIIPNNTTIQSWAQQSRRLTSLAVDARSAPKEKDHVAVTSDGVHGLGVVDDGSIILHSPGGTIVGGRNGMYIGSDNLILATGGTKQYGLFQEAPSLLKYLPSLFFLPNASRWPDGSLAMNIGGRAASAGNIAREIQRL